MKKLFFLFFAILLSACQTKNSITTNLPRLEDEKQVIESTPINKNLLSTFFEETELKAMFKIKEQFDLGLSGGKDIKNITRLYENHAQRMRLDLFNNFPYTLNFPYNGKFDLSDVDALYLEQLRFINNKCGFQYANGTKSNFICLSSPSNYMEFLETIGKESSLVAFLFEDYTKNKTITNTAKQRILLDSEKELDFTKIEHQIIYLFFHVFVNEERIALEKLES